MAGAAVRLCAVAVVLVGGLFGGGPAWARSGAPVAGSGASAAGSGASASAGGPARAVSGAWRAESSGTGQPLYAVACLSAVRCEAVGAAGTILATANGGRTWRAQANPLRGSGKILYRIACVAPSSCYAIARPDTILVTHNGGATWSRHVLAVGVTGGNLTDKACLAATAFSIRGRPALCRLGLLDIACVTARACYAVATAPAAYALTPLTPHGAAGSSVWATRDGGASWARQSVPAGVPCDGDCTPGRYAYPLEWVSCLSGGLCRAGGGKFLGCGHCGFAYAMLATTGPGKPWRLVTCSGAGCTLFSPDAGACPTSARCYGVYSTSPFDAGTLVYRSVDGGASWQAGPSGSGSIRSGIACPAARTCYTIGDAGTITRTANGVTFAAEHSPVRRDLYGVSCVGTTVCYAVGAGGTILARH